MESRRKALGLRKLNVDKDKQNKEVMPKKSTKNLISVSRAQEENTQHNKANNHGSNLRRNCVPSVLVTPKQCIQGAQSADSPEQCIQDLQSSETPKRCVRVVKSTGTPKGCIQDLQSAHTPKRSMKGDNSAVPTGMDSLFPKLLGSPEVDVTWDWGCSQIPKDMSPTVRGSPKQPTMVLSPLVQESRLLQRRQMSEEENQARLEFYKSVLSQALKCKVEEKSTSIRSDLLDDETQLSPCTTKQNIDSPKESKLSIGSNVHRNSSTSKCSRTAKNSLKNDVTPKITTPMLHTTPPKADKELLTLLFDDSVNDLMLECSQMVEEQLRTGLDKLGPVINVKDPCQKHALSPQFGKDNHKKLCNIKSKLCLFSESSNNICEGAKSNEQEKYLRSQKLVRLKNQSSYNSMSQSNNSNESENIEINYIKSSSFTEDEQYVKTSLNNGCVSNIENEKNVLSCGKDSEKRRSNRVYFPKVSKPSVMNSNGSILKRELPNTNKQMSVNNSSVNCHVSTTCKQVQVNVNNVKYDSVDKFRRVSKSILDSNQNVHILSTNRASKDVIHAVPSEERPELRNTLVSNNDVTQRRTNKFQETKQNAADLTSLLDDGFDVELSSLDVDSICRNSQAPVKPKLCSKAEIEAKRLEALARLRMKMRKDSIC